MTNCIDFVVTWVDGNDPAWREEKQRYQIRETTSASNNLNAENRYRDWGLMRYWFRGIEAFAPWVHRVYFITWGHIPAWLDTTHPKLQIVRHEDYIPQTYLPTFNSNTIELNIHRISGLSEQFVLFNDDFFLTAPTAPELFFSEGLPRDYFLCDINAPQAKTDDFAHICLNNINIINKYFDKRQILKKHRKKIFHPCYGAQLSRNVLLLPWERFSEFKNFHLTAPLLKCTLETLWKLEPEKLDASCRHRFRNADDVNQYLIREWQLCEGTFIPINPKFGKHFELGQNNEEMYKAIAKGQYSVVCINDSDMQIDFEAARRQLQLSFQMLLPNKSSFEKE